MIRLALVAALLAMSAASCAQMPETDDDSARAPRWSPAIVTGGTARGSGG